MCRIRGEKWVDDGTWVYECNAEDGTYVACLMGKILFNATTYTFEKLRTDAYLTACATATPSKEEVQVGSNKTVNGLWHSCQANNEKLKYESGCYYANETHPDVYLKIGESGYNGLIKHVCDRYEDYPGRVQYYAEVRNDVHVKHPTNKGINKNFQEPADLRIKGKVDRWLHESASLFIANEEIIRAKIRYLPASRKQWPTGQN
uniref:SCP domain-containing protein n=1 Tax=Heterorhabditis bacteriophora TaxID=37862 RepID=A0A1I7XQJ0_HETBA